MNNVQKTNSPKEMLSAILIAVKHLFLHNWGMKLIALFLSIALWAGLISQDPTLTRDRVFNGVNVTVNGKDTMTRNGFVIVDDLDELLQNVQINVAVPQQLYETVEASNYNVRVDLSKINSPGRQELKLIYSNSGTYGKITGITPETITVDVDEYITRTRIPVSVSLVGDIPSGWYITAPTADPSLIAVSGPKSIVESISRARVTVDPSEIIWEEGVSRIAAPFVLYNRSGEPVSNSEIETTGESILIQSVVVEQSIYPTRSIRVSDLGMIKGNTAKGYEITNLFFSPEEIIIAAPQTALDMIDELYLSSVIDVSGKNESFAEQVSIKKTSDMISLNADTVTVKVEISPVVAAKNYNECKIEMVNLSDGLAATLSHSKTDISVVGNQLWLDGITKKMISVYVDLGGITEPGEYTLPVDCEINGSEDQDFTWMAETDEVIVSIRNK